MELSEINTKDYYDNNMVKGIYLVCQNGIWNLYDYDAGFFIYHDMPINKYADVHPDKIYGPIV